MAVDLRTSATGVFAQENSARREEGVAAAVVIRPAGQALARGEAIQGGEQGRDAHCDVQVRDRLHTVSSPHPSDQDQEHAQPRRQGQEPVQRMLDLLLDPLHQP